MKLSTLWFQCNQDKMRLSSIPKWSRIFNYLPPSPCVLKNACTNPLELRITKCIGFLISYLYEQVVSCVPWFLCYLSRKSNTLQLTLDEYFRIYCTYQNVIIPFTSHYRYSKLSSILCWLMVVCWYYCITTRIFKQEVLLLVYVVYNMDFLLSSMHQNEC